jgi:hypothetical protein
MAGREVVVNQVAPDSIYGRDTIEAVSVLGETSPSGRSCLSSWGCRYPCRTSSRVGASRLV